MAAESQSEGYVAPLALSVFMTCTPLDQLERLKKEPIQKADPTEIEKLF